MHRPDFIKVVVGSAIPWPLTARAAADNAGGRISLWRITQLLQPVTTRYLHNQGHFLGKDRLAAFSDGVIADYHHDYGA